MKKYSLLLFLLLWMIHYQSFAKGFTLKSSAFQTNSIIPDKYTCKGIDQSPPLTWYGVPPNTKSLALIVEDPDSPSGVWTHWILFNISPKVNQLAAGSPIPPGAKSTKNSWGKLGYSGPCPPLGVAHSYHFKLYALDTVLDFEENPPRDTVLNAITGHVIGSTELVGLFQTLKNNSD